MGRKREEREYNNEVAEQTSANLLNKEKMFEDG
jgi:hypothetical protein